MLEQVDDAELPERQPNVLSYRVVAADLILALEITDPNGVSDRPHIFFFRKNDSAGNSSLRLDFADLDHAANFYEVIDSFVSSWERYIKFVPLALTLCSGNELELLSDYRVRSRLGRENIDIGTKGRIVVAASAKSRTIKKKGAKTTAKN